MLLYTLFVASITLPILDDIEHEIVKANNILHPKNWMFVKLHKVGGTTVVDACMRASTYTNRKIWNSKKDITDAPGFWWKHSTFKELPKVSPAFYFTWLRKPSARCLSRYYFSHSTMSKLRYMHGCIGYARNRIGNLENYDFIGITEHMDESILKLANLLVVPIHSILYRTLKNSTDQHVPGFKHGLTRHKSLKEEPEEVQRFARRLDSCATNVDMCDYENALEKLKNQRFSSRELTLLKSVQQNISRECVRTEYCFKHDKGCFEKCKTRVWNDVIATTYGHSVALRKDVARADAVRSSGLK